MSLLFLKNLKFFACVEVGKNEGLTGILSNIQRIFKVNFTKSGINKPCGHGGQSIKMKFQ